MTRVTRRLGRASLILSVFALSTPAHALNTSTHPTPIPSSDEEIAYRVRCRHGAETAESLVILRQDVDGVWRLVSF